MSLLLTTLLAPAGIVVGTVTAAALISGAFHLNRAEPETADTPVHPVTVKTASPHHLDIEREGKTVALVLADDPDGQGSGNDGFNPANPLFAGLAGNGPTQAGKPLPAGGFGPGSGGPTNPPSLGGPHGGGAPTGANPPATPSTPPVAGGPRPPTGKDDTDETSNEEWPPEKPDETQTVPPPPVSSQPNPDNQPPGNGLPQDTLPGLQTPPLADTQTPPPGKQLATQPNAVPEPSMLGLMLLGVAALVWNRRRPDSFSPA
ncbi:MAG: PEP-CTERM sorting domain-containing protein [Gammaproteobacteria bacterium]